MIAFRDTPQLPEPIPRRFIAPRSFQCRANSGNPPRQPVGGIFSTKFHHEFARTQLHGSDLWQKKRAEFVKIVLLPGDACADFRCTRSV